VAGETDRPTLSASSCMVMRLSVCSRPRILRSMASSQAWDELGYQGEVEIYPNIGRYVARFEILPMRGPLKSPILMSCPSPAWPSSPPVRTVVRAGAKVLWLSSWTIHHANHIRPQRR